MEFEASLFEKFEWKLQQLEDELRKENQELKKALQQHDTEIRALKCQISVVDARLQLGQLIDLMINSKDELDVSGEVLQEIQRIKSRVRNSFAHPQASIEFKFKHLKVLSDEGLLDSREEELLKGLCIKLDQLSQFV